MAISEKERLEQLGKQLRDLLFSNKNGINNDLIKETINKIRKIKYG